MSARHKYVLRSMHSLMNLDHIETNKIHWNLHQRTERPYCQARSHIVSSYFYTIIVPSDQARSDYLSHIFRCTKATSSTRDLTTPLPTPLPHAPNLTHHPRRRPISRMHPISHNRQPNRIKMIIVQLQYPPLPPPVHSIKEHVHALFATLRSPDWLRADWRAVSEVDEWERGAGGSFTGVLLQPLPQELVPAPFALHEFGGGALLEHVAWVLVEDGEEGFYIK